MISFPNCKINIGLYITNKREDGFHDLETIFYPVNIYDALEIIPAKKTSLQITGKEITGDSRNNLVWRAFGILKDRFPGKINDLAIYLNKAIPMGAGLGGGSSDGAFMIRMLNDYYKLGMNKTELAGLALQLGSDCPFFIENTAQFAIGRGEHMTPVDIDLSGYSVQIIYPGIHISTAEAFKKIRPQKAPYDLRMLPQLPIQLWKEYVSNDFELPAIEKHPVVKEIIDQMYRQDAIYASMTGSGSAIYGIFNKRKKAEIAVNIPIESFYAE
jgi:4-diphosphocytidyl-2-C-methyl-D-erythritol kinase